MQRHQEVHDGADVPMARKLRGVQFAGGIGLALGLAAAAVRIACPVVATQVQLGRVAVHPSVGAGVVVVGLEGKVEPGRQPTGEQQEERRARCAAPVRLGARDACGGSHGAGDSAIPPRCGQTGPNLASSGQSPRRRTKPVTRPVTNPHPAARADDRPRRLPGELLVGFTAKSDAESFVVEERPASEPSGEPGHVWLWVEKRGIATEEAAHGLARALGRPPRAATWAGRKDVHATTRQWIAVEGADEAAARALVERGATQGAADDSGTTYVRVLDARSHPRGLRLGQIRGNRFRLALDGLDTKGWSTLSSAVAELTRVGVPAWYGAQRYGHGGRGARVGLALVRGRLDEFARLLVGEPHTSDYGAVREARELAAAGDFDGAARRFPGRFALERRAAQALAAGVRPERLPEQLGRTELLFLANAAQSYLFDRVLERRFPELGRLLAGDVAHLHTTRGSFQVEDAALEQPRADRFELSPTAPLFGRRLRPSSGGEARAIELDVLAEAGLDEDQFELPIGSARGPWRLEGARRPLRWPLAAASLETLVGQRAWLCFELPAGAYATEVLAELGGTLAPPAGQNRESAGA
ncbi:MAG: tRNA pseudouridine(13) synthase TruD [Planctomycetaceae bacterium]|nr:tRNA pseudouridine(13) synthase TruD [Planctomycetaceae bacterium]